MICVTPVGERSVTNVRRGDLSGRHEVEMEPNSRSNVSVGSIVNGQPTQQIVHDNVSQTSK